MTWGTLHSDWFLLKIPFHHLRAGLYKYLFVFRKGIGEVALDIQLSHQFFLYQDRHYDLRFHEGGPCEITRILRHIGYDHRLPGARRGSAQPNVERDARVRRKTSHERSDQQNVWIGWVHEIEADPVVAGHLFVETLSNPLHERCPIGRGLCKLFEFGKQFLVHMPPGGLDRLSQPGVPRQKISSRRTRSLMEQFQACVRRRRSLTAIWEGLHDETVRRRAACAGSRTDAGSHLRSIHSDVRRTFQDHPSSRHSVS